MEIRTIPPKLERFLMTIARRSSIKSIFVAAVVVKGGEVLINKLGTLPRACADESGISDALAVLLERLELEGENAVSYVGYFDSPEKTRQYHFLVRCKNGMEDCICSPIKDAAGMLSQGEAKILAALSQKMAN